MVSLLDILKEIKPECDFEQSQDFIADGLLDSLDIVILVSKLEELFDIVIEGDKVTQENFQNLHTLEKLIQQ